MNLSEEQIQHVYIALAKEILELNRLESLTNEQLVAEVLSTEAADSPIVKEMMDRLHPNWMELTPEEAAAVNR